ncbi:MAG: hypothetical protein ACYCPM_13030 [Acidobacteriaceae bacterium]
MQRKHWGNVRAKSYSAYSKQRWIAKMQRDTDPARYKFGHDKEFETHTLVSASSSFALLAVAVGAVAVGAVAVGAFTIGKLGVRQAARPH